MLSSRDWVGWLLEWLGCLAWTSERVLLVRRRLPPQPASSSRTVRLSQNLAQCSLLTSNGKSLGGGLLVGNLAVWLVGLCHVSNALRAVELDVTVGGQVGADATVSTVGSPAAGDGALGHGVGDDALVGVKLLGLSVGLEVDEELADDLHALLGPSALLVVELLEHGVSRDGSIVPSEGNDALALKHILEVVDGLLDMHALAGAHNFVRVLVVSSEVSNLALSG